MALFEIMGRSRKAHARQFYPTFFVVVVSMILTGMACRQADGANASASTCNAETISTLETSTGPIMIACSIMLEPNAVIHAPIVFAGSAASQGFIDCRGGAIKSDAVDQVALTIASVRLSDGRWDVPKHISVRNCSIEGAIRVVGMGANGEAELVKQSSLSTGHTERAQAAAPSDIVLSNLKIIAKGAIPLYAGPGTTKLTLANSTFSGQSGSVAIYLDAESADNTISNNHFELATKTREIVAVDGSAHDIITGNTFDNPIHGGVFLYRNCGEGGTIRHQPPQHNTISNNLFRYTDRGLASWWATKPAIWLGSRQGNRSYCFHDATRPFGSSLSSGDEAKYNVVRDNMFEGGSDSLIANDDDDNQVVRSR